MFIPGACRARIKTLRFFCALALVWMAAGEVYVVRGQSSTFVEIPGTQWAARFNGPANHNDRRPVMALDAHGNVYVAAETQSLTPAPAYGLEGNNTDIVTIKYDPSGNQLWAATFKGPGQYVDSPKDIGVDAEGNVFVAGYSWRGRQSEGGTDYDFVTLKYDAGGNQRWVRYYSGAQTPSRSDQAFALELDQAGNAYVTGGSFYNGVNDWLAMQFATVKYDAQGNQVWVRNFDGEDRAGAMPVDVKVDAAGNVFVAGVFNSLSPVTNTYASDFVLLKYGPAGDLLKQTRYDTPGSNIDDEDRADRMHLDAQGNVYLLGDSFPNLGEEVSSRMDAVLVKFSNDGGLVWAATYTRPGETEERGFGFVTDSAGNVYVTGATDDRKFFLATFTVKYDAGGRLLWERVLDLTPDDADHSVGMVIAPAEDAVHLGVVAISDQANNHYDYTVVKYLADGTEAGVKKYDNPEHSDDALARIEIDAAGNLYLAGSMRTAPGATSTFDLLTVKVSPATYTLGGRVAGPTGQPLAGVNVTLTGSASRTTTADDGTYAFDDLAAGSTLTVTPARAGQVFIPARQEVTMNSDETVNFTAVPGYTISGAVTLNGAGLGGVTLTLTGGPAGFAPRTVKSAATTGAYSFGSLPAGQSYVVTASSSVYSFTPASTSHPSLAANQTAQNFSATRKAYTIGGKVLLGAAALAGYKLTLTSSAAGFAPRRAVTLGDGSYSFAAVPAGFAYTVSPAASSVYSFTPAGRSYPNLAATQAGQNFTAAHKLYTVSGRVLQGSAGLGGVGLTLRSTTAGFTPRTLTSDASTGAYAFPRVPAGRTYVVTAASNIYTFTPASRTLSGLSANQTGQNFTVSARKTYAINGRVTRAGTTTGIGGVSMTLTNGSTGAVVKTVTTAADGRYSLTAIPAGITYVLRPSKGGAAFNPASRTFANLSANQTAGPNTNFTGP